MKKNLTKDFEEYFELDELIKKLEARRDEIKKKLKAEAEKTEEKVLLDGDYKIQLVSCNRTGFDTKAFAATHPKLAAKFTTNTPYVQTKITHLKAKG